MYIVIERGRARYVEDGSGLSKANYNAPSLSVPEILNVTFSEILTA
jgi:hypothetical protein